MQWDGIEAPESDCCGVEIEIGDHAMIPGILRKVPGMEKMVGTRTHPSF